MLCGAVALLSLGTKLSVGSPLGGRRRCCAKRFAGAVKWPCTSHSTVRGPRRNGLALNGLPGRRCGKHHDRCDCCVSDEGSYRTRLPRRPPRPRRTRRTSGCGDPGGRSRRTGARRTASRSEQLLRHQAVDGCVQTTTPLAGLRCHYEASDASRATARTASWRAPPTAGALRRLQPRAHRTPCQPRATKPVSSTTFSPPQ